MPVNTAGKRQSMMGFGSPIVQFVVIPDGSIDLRDRRDLLYLYGGLALDAPAEPEATTTEGAGGGRKKRKRAGYPRRVVIDGRVYTVRSAEEERELLRQLVAAREAALEALQREEAPAPAVRKARVAIRRARARLEDVAAREDEHYTRLRREDDEILLAVLH